MTLNRRQMEAGRPARQATPRRVRRKARERQEGMSWRKFGLEFVDLDDFGSTTSCSAAIPVDLMLRYSFVPWQGRRIRWSWSWPIPPT